MAERHTEVALPVGGSWVGAVRLEPGPGSDGGM